jgi:hypothetical protein
MNKNPTLVNGNKTWLIRTVYGLIITALVGLSSWIFLEVRNAPIAYAYKSEVYKITDSLSDRIKDNTAKINHVDEKLDNCVERIEKKIDSSLDRIESKIDRIAK